MNIRRAAVLALVGWCLLGPPLSWAQGRAEGLKTFTAPDGAFSFRYANLLTHCAKDQQGDWSPENCFDLVCDDVVAQAEGDLKSIACFAYPRNKFTHSPAFLASTFSVEVVNDGATEKSCLAPKISDLFEERAGTTTIHGVSFAVISFSTVGMGSGVDGRVYRTLHRGRCYQLGINDRRQSVQDFDPPVSDLTDADDREINARLEQARKSFRFLK
jgi:hypothetical protein